MSGDDTGHRRWRHAEYPRHLCCGLPTRDDRLGDLTPLGTSLPPRQACRGALPDHGALELGEGADHLHHHPAGRRGGVDVLGQRAEAGACLADLLHDVQQVLQRAGTIRGTSSPLSP